MTNEIEQAFHDWMSRDDNELRTMPDDMHPFTAVFKAGWIAGQARVAMHRKEDCSICQNSGTYCIGTSGLACDGNAPIFERCECEWGFSDEEVAPPPPPTNEPVALKATDIVLTSLDFSISGPTAEIVKFARRIIAQARGEK